MHFASACTLLIFEIQSKHLLKGFLAPTTKYKRREVLVEECDGILPVELAHSLPSHTEAVLVAVVTPNAPFRHLIFVFPLFWQLPGNRQLGPLVDLMSVKLY